MKAWRVYVIWTYPLFHESLRLLLNHPGIEWVGATSDHEAALSHVANLRPDIILMEEVEGSDISAETVKLLECSSMDVRIIRLSLANNELTIYHREQRNMGQAEDLLKLIQGE